MSEKHTELKFDQEVLNQVAIFNAIIEYIKAICIPLDPTKNFESNDCKYECIFNTRTITIKPSSQIFPLIQSLNIDALNKFDVQILNVDEINTKIDALAAVFPEYIIRANSRKCTRESWPEVLLKTLNKTAIDRLLERLDPTKYVIRLGDPYDSQSSNSLHYKFLSHLQPINILFVSLSSYMASIKKLQYSETPFNSTLYIDIGIK